MTELLLVAFAQRLPGEIDLVLTYYLPNDSFGRWNPLLKAMGCSRLASRWAVSSRILRGIVT